jgi:hypothetical protein
LKVNEFDLKTELRSPARAKASPAETCSLDEYSNFKDPAKTWRLACWGELQLALRDFLPPPDQRLAQWFFGERAAVGFSRQHGELKFAAAR